MLPEQDAKPDHRIDISDSGTELESMDAVAGGDDPQEIELELSEDAMRYVQQLQAELAEAAAARQRALADFRNFQRRSLENEQRARCDGVNAVILSLVPVLDHFDLALNQELEALDVEGLMNGVQIVRDEITKTLQSHGVEVVAPEIGDEFDPNRHEAMLRQPAEGIDPNHIVMVFQPGYVMGDIVLRPAKVAVAPGEEE